MYKPKAYRRDRAQYNPNFKPIATDRRILEYLVRYRYLRSTFIRELLGVCKQTGNNRLHLLWTNHYIDKPEGQGNGYNSLNDAHIYEITKKGREYLDETLPEATNFHREKTDMPPAQFRHMMMVCDMLASIEIGMQGSGCSFITQAEILSKTTVKDPLRLPATISFNGKPFHTYGKPDAVFGIRYENGKSRLFLVEAEHKGAVSRTTASLSSTMKKVLVYQNVKQTGAIKQLKKHGFTVLFGVPTKARIKHSQELVVRELGKSDLFLFAYVPTHERLYQSPKPRPELFTGTWERGGMDPISIKETPPD